MLMVCMQDKITHRERSNMKGYLELQFFFTIPKWYMRLSLVIAPKTLTLIPMKLYAGKALDYVCNICANKLGILEKKEGCK